MLQQQEAEWLLVPQRGCDWLVWLVLQAGREAGYRTGCRSCSSWRGNKLIWTCPYLFLKTLFTALHITNYISVTSKLIMAPCLKSFPYGSAGKESACNEGDLGSIPGLGRSSGEGKGYPLQYSGLERIPWTVLSMRSQTVRHNWVTFTSLPCIKHIFLVMSFCLA